MKRRYIIEALGVLLAAVLFTGWVLGVIAFVTWTQL
jgi:hypothetical protein